MGHSLAKRIRNEIEGEYLSDDFSRGRYSTDASIYQLMPVGVVVPKSLDDVEATIKIAREEGLPVLPRGSGTSQNGQAIGEAVLIDTTRHLNELIDLAIDKWSTPISLAAAVTSSRFCKLCFPGILSMEE